MGLENKLKVLVVDDSAIIRKIITKVLQEMGAEAIHEAVNGQAALIKLTTCGQIDLILSDWNMPEMNGLEFLKKLKGDPVYMAYRGIPVIMVTTEAEKGNVLEALKSGASNYLVKPFPPDALKLKIGQTLWKKEAVEKSEG